MPYVYPRFPYFSMNRSKPSSSSNCHYKLMMMCVFHTWYTSTLMFGWRGTHLYMTEGSAETQNILNIYYYCCCTECSRRQREKKLSQRITNTYTSLHSRRLLSRPLVLWRSVKHTIVRQALQIGNISLWLKTLREWFFQSPALITIILI